MCQIFSGSLYLIFRILHGHTVVSTPGFKQECPISNHSPGLFFKFGVFGLVNW